MGPAFTDYEDLFQHGNFKKSTYPSMNVKWESTNQWDSRQASDPIEVEDGVFKWEW